MLNELVRTTFACNQKCIFCDVKETNNFEIDISEEEIINNIITLQKKHKWNLEDVVLTLSWGEPLINRKIFKYIRFSRKLWFENIEIQTNWTFLFRRKKLIKELQEEWLNMLFLAYHSHKDEINKKMGISTNINEFLSRFNYIKRDKIDDKLQIVLNIVLTKQNVYIIDEYVKFLLTNWIIESLFRRELNVWFVYPNWNARNNRFYTLLDFNRKQIKKIKKMINLCKENNIDLNFGFSLPPFCVLDYPEYSDDYNAKINEENFTKNTKRVSIEKTKISFCNNCHYKSYCDWFNRNFLDFMWGKSSIKKIIYNNYLFWKQL